MKTLIVNILVIADFKEVFLDKIKLLLDPDDEIGLPLELLGYTSKEFLKDAKGGETLHSGGH